MATLLSQILFFAVTRATTLSHVFILSTALVFVTMQMRREMSKCNISTHISTYFCFEKVATAESFDAHKENTFMTL